MSQSVPIFHRLFRRHIPDATTDSPDHGARWLTPVIVVQWDCGEGFTPLSAAFYWSSACSSLIKAVMCVSIVANTYSANTCGQGLKWNACVAVDDIHHPGSTNFFFNSHNLLIWTDNVRPLIIIPLFLLF
jgi:hypothetical protein